MGVGGPWRVSIDELMDKNLPYFVGGNLATLDGDGPLSITLSICTSPRQQRSRGAHYEQPTLAEYASLEH